MLPGAFQMELEISSTFIFNAVLHREPGGSQRRQGLPKLCMC